MMIEKWRAWRWKAYERRVSASDDFAEFERLFSGPLTPALASKMPLTLLLDKRIGQVDQEARSIIDSEINRRLNSRQPMIANIMSAIALILSIIALTRAS
jgi:hypothetical protein